MTGVTFMKFGRAPATQITRTAQTSGRARHVGGTADRRCRMWARLTTVPVAFGALPDAGGTPRRKPVPMPGPDASHGRRHG